MYFRNSYNLINEKKKKKVILECSWLPVQLKGRGISVFNFLIKAIKKEKYLIITNSSQDKIIPKKKLSLQIYLHFRAQRHTLFRY